MRMKDSSALLTLADETDGAIGQSAAANSWGPSLGVYVMQSWVSYALILCDPDSLTGSGHVTRPV